MFALGDLDNLKELKSQLILKESEIYIVNICIAYYCLKQRLTGDITNIHKKIDKKRPIVIYKCESNKAYFFPLSTNKNANRIKDISFDYSKCSIQNECQENINKKKAFVYIDISENKVIKYKGKRKNIPYKFNIDLIILEKFIAGGSEFIEAQEKCSKSGKDSSELFKYCGYCNKDYIRSVKSKIYGR